MAAPEDSVTEGVRADLDRYHTLERHCHDIRRRQPKACPLSVLPNWETCTLPTTVL
jgi:hypothetical protein